MEHQTTLAGEIQYSGIGLHSGLEVHMRIKPAPAGTGVVFERTDIDGRPRVRASARNVAATMRATTIEE
ncbi:MAG: UDP-3-O-acyl-N-acetylglucosamine deacetylase, partial [Schwartzia sp.]|nr:UDP-3-O-acyl-N-acetylglucosamine deacetylase [Schwartzia sp. (in: firmicutes)]